MWHHGVKHLVHERKIKITSVCPFAGERRERRDSEAKFSSHTACDRVGTMQAGGGSSIETCHDQPWTTTFRRTET
jgi:hypothetical protein